jgi:ABC-type multidrug transport system permease subunit
VTVFKYALRRGLFQPLSLILNCVMPIALIVIAPGGAFDPQEGRGFFMMALLILYGAFMMAGSIQADRIDRVTFRILAGPVTLRSYLMQNFFAGLVPMMVLCSIIGVLGIILHDWQFMFALGVVICFILLAAVSVGMSFVWSIWFKDKETSMPTFPFVLMLMGFLGGLLLPLSQMPSSLRTISTVVPAHWASRGMEELMAYGITVQYWLSMLALAFFAAALILYGSKRRIM